MNHPYSLTTQRNTLFLASLVIELLNQKKSEPS